MRREGRGKGRGTEDMGSARVVVEGKCESGGRDNGGER